MVQNISALELGKTLGNALYNTQLYKDNFIDTEETTNIDLYMGETIEITGTYIVSSRALPGSAFIIDHPVYGNIDYDTAVKAAYRFEGNANDSTSNANNGTVTGADLTSSGISGSAYDFNTAGDRILINDTSALRLTNGGTISLWIYARTTGVGTTFGRLIDKSTDTSSTNGYSLAFDTGSVLAFRVNASVNRTNVPAVYVPLNTWLHVAVVFSSSGRAIYINGVDRVSTGGSETGLPPDVSGSVCIGNQASAYARTFDGIIDEVTIWNRVLSQSEITDIYNSGSPNYYPNSTVGAYGYHLDGNYAVSSSLISSGSL